jgi:hypothetical protein
MVKVIVPFVLLGGLGVALADKLSDFKEAAGNDGCASIPYSDYRSTCESQQSPVHDWCDGGRGPVSCAGGESGTRQVKDAVDRRSARSKPLRTPSAPPTRTAASLA